MTRQSVQDKGADLAVGIESLKAGDKIWWKYSSCKAFTPQKIPAVVLWTGKTRVRIEFAQWVREEWVRQVRTVAHTNLSPRDEACHGIDKFHPNKAQSLAA